MRVLLVKLSSMGDVIHTLPAITDAAKVIPSIKFTWLIDSGFAEIASWHPAVEKVIPIDLRKRNIQQIFASIKNLRAQKYDLVIDAQGLLKSAVLAKLVSSKLRAGYDKNSARETMASIFYNNKIAVASELHAVARLRKLFAIALNYPEPASEFNYGVDWSNIIQSNPVTQPYIVFLHGTTWDSKHWPEAYWLQLATIAAQHGFKVQVTWSTAEQEQRAQRFALQASNVVKLPHLTISQAATVLQQASGIVAVDTGFAHLSAALNKPLVALYGPTDIKKVGAVGGLSINLASKFNCAPCSRRICNYTGDKTINPPCFKEISPQLVWENLATLL